ncbi:hypothetical protein OG943_16045 [Amycolatopsis sp. NBC_00345]|uniref:hypothetical protein n=1 Tax=Amycolatopsis sp. NBC_00345 TaxID=2975955 RepID=UPI002E2567CA
MMSWTPTPKRTAINTLATLWCQPAWQSSQHADSIREILRDKADDADDVIRLHVAQVARRLSIEPEAGFGLVRDRLLVEKQSLVATVLLWELWDCGSDRPEEVDVVLASLVKQEPWTLLLNETQSNSDHLEPLDIITSLALVLAIRHQTPAAQELVRTWLSDPIATAAAQHAVGNLRAWTELPSGQATERARAFDMLEAATAALAQLRHSAADSPDQLDRIFATADLISRNINFASEAVLRSGGHPTEDREFAARALAVLDGIAQFKHPSITHFLIEALSHLAAADPSQAFHTAATAVDTGDEYTYDSVAAAETTKFIERYLAEFREAVIADDKLLTAIRSVLHAFVDAGWPSAISLAYRLSEAFR